MRPIHALVLLLSACASQQPMPYPAGGYAAPPQQVIVRQAPQYPAMPPLAMPPPVQPYQMQPPAQPGRSSVTCQPIRTMNGMSQVCQ